MSKLDPAVAVANKKPEVSYNPDSTLLSFMFTGVRSNVYTNTRAATGEYIAHPEAMLYSYPNGIGEPRESMVVSRPKNMLKVRMNYSIEDTAALIVFGETQYFMDIYIPTYLVKGLEAHAHVPSPQDHDVFLNHICIARIEYELLRNDTADIKNFAPRINYLIQSFLNTFVDYMKLDTGLEYGFMASGRYDAKEQYRFIISGMIADYAKQGEYYSLGPTADPAKYMVFIDEPELRGAPSSNSDTTNTSTNDTVSEQRPTIGNEDVLIDGMRQTAEETLEDMRSETEAVIDRSAARNAMRAATRLARATVGDLTTMTAGDIGAMSMSTIDDRASSYDLSEDNGERSFARTATAFNAITGHDLTPAEVALMLELLKNVRQWSATEVHVDSIIDGPAYSMLKGEELLLEHRLIEMGVIKEKKSVYRG